MIDHPVDPPLDPPGRSAATLAAAETFATEIAVQVPEFAGVTRGRALDALDAAASGADPAEAAARVIDPDLDHCSAADYARVLRGARVALAAARVVLAENGGGQQ